MKTNPERGLYRGASCDFLAIETNRHLDVSLSVATLLRAQGFEQAHAHLLDADVSRQMNQLQGANTDTTLCPILTVHRAETGSDCTPNSFKSHWTQTTPTFIV